MLCTSWYVDAQPPEQSQKVSHPTKVRVGHDSLVGEVIRIEADKATVQVYEETGKSRDFSLDLTRDAG